MTAKAHCGRQARPRPAGPALRHLQLKLGRAIVARGGYSPGRHSPRACARKAVMTCPRSTRLDAGRWRRTGGQDRRRLCRCTATPRGAGALKASLTVMAGGAASMSSAPAVTGQSLRQLYHMGPSGAGQTTKLVNQVLCAIVLPGRGQACPGEARGRSARSRKPWAGGRADSRILQESARKWPRGDYARPAHRQHDETSRAWRALPRPTAVLASLGSRPAPPPVPCRRPRRRPTRPNDESSSTALGRGSAGEGALQRSDAQSRNGEVFEARQRALDHRFCAGGSSLSHPVHFCICSERRARSALRSRAPTNFTLPNQHRQGE